MVQVVPRASLENISDDSLVCKLHKALYGLKQAPRGDGESKSLYDWGDGESIVIGVGLKTRGGVEEFVWLNDF